MLIALMAMLCYSVIAYVIPRTSFAIFIVMVTVLFVLFMLMTAKDFSQDHFKELLLLAFLSRLIFLFAFPSLSDDYFRFIWDGVLTNNGINPYLGVPGSINIVNGRVLPEFLLELKANMNSLPYFSPYPPVLQFVFFVSVKSVGYHLLNDLVIFRILALLAEAGTVYITIKMLDHFKLPRQRVLLYALNPLVVIELSGNLHGEVFMIFFLALSFYLLIKQQYLLSAVFLGLAVSTKLLPLIFIPAVISFIGTRKGIVFSLITLITLTVSFIPFMDAAFLQHILESLGYYFQKFEFNASIYYLLRWIGYDITGFNLIYIIGMILPVVAFVFILRIAWYKKIQTPAMLFERLLFTLLVYYLFSLIVHPWYITLLVALSVFTVRRFAFAWSALVMLTYSTYLQTPYHEILWVTALEYIVLGVIVFVEIWDERVINIYDR
ncbi:MAG: hypothetical protein H7Z13_06845 [Ferruginibacter sp.]|nr:hypothetical protein [Ferruginibacter sp.]